MPIVQRLLDAGASVTEGPWCNGVRWLRIGRHGGVHYVASGDQVGLMSLAEAMERGRLPGEDPSPGKRPKFPKPGRGPNPELPPQAGKKK